MFNWDGQIVADALYVQQAGEVIRGILDNRNTMKVADQEKIILEQHYAQLVARYNRLADRYNAVVEENNRVDASHAEAIADKDRRIAELTADNDRLAAEKEECRQSASEGWANHHDALVEIERLKLKCGELLPDERNPDADL